MASLNQCNFIGNVGNEPDMRYLPSGEAVANLSLAVNETWKDKQGQKQEHTEWVRISFFGALAEVISKYVHKGDPLYVSGSLKTRKYTDKEGVEKYATEIRGDRMQMLGSRQDSEPAQHKASRQAMDAQRPPASDFDDGGDIPF